MLANTFCSFDFNHLSNNNSSTSQSLMIFRLKADIFNSSDQNTILTNLNSLSSSALPPSYPSEKHNILANPAPPPPLPTTTTTTNINNNNNTNSSANEKDTVTKLNINHATSNASPTSQVKQGALIASQPIKINYREENKDRRAKQLDLKHLTSEKIQSKFPTNAETTNTNEHYYAKSQSTQNSQPSSLCMSPRCPPDGAAAFHEISPSNLLNKSKKSVIYENLIDRYLLVEKNEYLKKELMTQQALATTTTTVTTSITTNTVTNNNNNNTSTISNHPLTTKITDRSTQKVSKLQEKLSEVSEKASEVIPHTSSGVASDKVSFEREFVYVCNLFTFLFYSYK
ncbi:unnamed protein product [Trichobilharzia regenti]|nr:unnamed protein product [Trichobilharzia regenti]